MWLTRQLSGRQINELLFKRVMSSHASAKRSEQSEHSLKTSTLPNGIIVTSLDSESPITRIGVIVKAGSRYEPPDQLGLTHTLRSMAGFSTKESTVFGITRNIEYVGGSLSAVTTRDHMLYVLENWREYTDKNIKYLSDTVTKPAFKPWEIKDNVERQKVDLSILKDSPLLLLSEALHSVAFRGGLRNSLYSPEFMIGKHSSEMLLNFVDNHFVSNRSAVVGLGIEHDRLLEYVDKHFSLGRGDRGQTGESKFIGGQTRIDANLPNTYVAIATEGVGYVLTCSAKRRAIPNIQFRCRAKNTKDVLALSLLQEILGTGPRVAFGDCRDTVLGEKVASTTTEPFSVSAFNITHSDTGLFGLTVTACPKDIGQAVRAAVTQLRESAKKISEEDLNSAKYSSQCVLKTLTINIESFKASVEDQHSVGHRRANCAPRRDRNSVCALRTSDEFE